MRLCTPHAKYDLGMHSFLKVLVGKFPLLFHVTHKSALAMSDTTNQCTKLAQVSGLPDTRFPQPLFRSPACPGSQNSGQKCQGEIAPTKDIQLNESCCLPILILNSNTLHAFFLACHERCHVANVNDVRWIRISYSQNTLCHRIHHSIKNNTMNMCVFASRYVPRKPSAKF